MLLNKLIYFPEQFNFFQAIRILEHASTNGLLPVENTEDLEDDKEIERIVHLDRHLALHDFVRFSSSPHKDFPIDAIESIKLERKLSGTPIPKVMVRFMGMLGINSAMPSQYTDQILKLIHQSNYIMNDFFDIFNHLFILQYYEAWKKSHFFVTNFICSHGSHQHNTFDIALLGISGNLSQNSMFPNVDKTNVDNINTDLNKLDKMSLNFASLFAGRHRSAVAFENMLREYFELPIQVLQFQGKWLTLKEKDRTILGGLNSAMGQYQALGKNIILGKKAWDVNCHLRLYVGPIHYNTFELLHPSKSLLRAISYVVKRYIRAEFSFDLQFELMAAEVPNCVVGKARLMQLGWNTWLKSKPMLHNGKTSQIKVQI